ncbi:tyrosine-type recombinase/integrase [Thalassotalea montiporae]
MSKVPQFTASYIETLEPIGREYSVSELITVGFRLRVMKTGRVCYTINKVVDGKKIRRTFGAYGEMSVEEARREAVKLGAELRVDRLNDPIKPSNRDNRLRRYLPSFYKSFDWQRLSEKTQVEYRRSIENLLHHPPFKDITYLMKRSVLKAYLDSIAFRAPVTANRTKAAISKLIQFLIDTDVLPYNVTLKLRKYPEKPRRRSLHSEDELKTLFAYLNSSKAISCLTSDSIKLYLLTGCRKEELRLLAPTELNMRESRFIIPDERSKTCQRIVPLVESAKFILAKYNSTDKLVLQIAGNELKTDTVNQALVRASEKLLVAKATCRDLRRTVGTIMAIQKVSLEVRKRVLGHKFKEVTDSVYNVYDFFDEKLAALTKVEDYLIDCGLWD